MNVTQTSGRERPRIFLVGMMGSGKTTVGRVLAEQLGVPYVDNDESLAERAGGGPGAVFEARGVDALHAAEAEALRAGLEASRETGAVIGVAASAVLDADLRELIRGSGSVAWLRARPETLLWRMTQSHGTESTGAGAGSGRPQFAPDMAAWLEEAARVRAPLFEQVAGVTVDVDELAPWRVAQTILDGAGLGAFGWLPGAYAGVVLDLDGLLVETETIWMEAKRLLYADRGFPFSLEDHLAVMGTSEDFTARVFARRFGLGEERVEEVRDDYLQRATALFEEGVPTRPGATALVAALRGRLPLALASNTRRELVDRILQLSGLDGSFDAIATADDAAPKPAPDIYLLACERLGVNPRSAVAIEDSPTGIRAAKAAGLTCIGVPSDPQLLPVGADRVAASLLELIEPDDWIAPGGTAGRVRCWRFGGFRSAAGG
ncbi:MAG: hypothetical protein QOH61_2213 [Chloroflexota bacterium]|nr:hypothetical protein [Chloroflexota bacterium]